MTGSGWAPGCLAAGIFRGTFVLDEKGGATGSGTTDNWYISYRYGSCPDWTATRQ